MKTNRRLILLALLAVLCGQEAQAFYNASTGRWLSRDPIGSEGGLNTCAMVGNNVINEVDVLGLLQLMHIGEGFQYVKGPPEFFWLGLQARLTPDEASRVGRKGVLLTKAEIRVRVSDCRGNTGESGGTMYYLDRFEQTGGNLIPFLSDFVMRMTDRKHSMTFQPVNFSASMFLSGRSSEGTEGEIDLNFEYALQPWDDAFRDAENLGFRRPSGRGYDRVFWPEASHKFHMGYPPYMWSYFAVSRGSYSMSFEWNNCCDDFAEFKADPSLPVGPQRPDRAPAPGAIYYR